LTCDVQKDDAMFSLFAAFDFINLFDVISVNARIMQN
jgi:hypothetical protein